MADQVTLAGIIAQTQLLTKLTFGLITLSMRVDFVANNVFRSLIDAALLVLFQHKKILCEHNALSLIGTPVDKSLLQSDDLVVVNGLNQLCSDIDTLVQVEDLETKQDEVTTLIATLKIIFPEKE